MWKYEISHIDIVNMRKNILSSTLTGLERQRISRNGSPKCLLTHGNGFRNLVHIIVFFLAWIYRQGVDEGWGCLVFSASRVLQKSCELILWVPILMK